MIANSCIDSIPLNELEYTSKSICNKPCSSVTQLQLHNNRHTGVPDEREILSCAKEIVCQLIVGNESKVFVLIRSCNVWVSNVFDLVNHFQ